MLKAVLQIILGVIIITSGIISYMVPEIIENFQQTTVVENEDLVLLGLQEDENWLVIIVDFPDFPSSDAIGVSQAENILNEQGTRYISELTGNQSALSVTVHPDVIRADGNLADYGNDNGEEIDHGTDGEFLPPSLAEEAVNKAKSEINWEDFDLNSDGVVDRLLILHTTKGQEDGGGSSDRIWSHFSELPEEIVVSDDSKVKHYTMASIKSPSKAFGTMIHEMLHQIGAADLYPVHDAQWANSWKGLGQWDIMASGNWNGNGAWPALPTSASMELMGMNRFQEIELAWPAGTSAPCIGPTIEMLPMSEGGESLKVRVSSNEYIWIEMKGSTGFESNLPGESGVLVTYQNLAMGEVSDNELNIDPDKPWLMVIEADQDNDLRYGRNEGESSDLFYDGQSFGESGVLVRSSSGVLVHWTASVSLINNTTQVSFTSSNCDPKFMFNFSQHESIVLDNQPISVETYSDSECILSHSLTSSDERIITLSKTILDSGKSNIDIQFSGTSDYDRVTIQGIIECGTSRIDIEHSIEYMGVIPNDGIIAGIVEYRDESSISIPVDILGNNSERFTLDLDGPLSRIGSVQEFQDLNENDVITIDIDPDNLLSEGMIVRGELHIYSDFGKKWSINIELIAEDTNSTGFDIRDITILLPLSLLLLGLSLIFDGTLGILKDKSRKPEEELPHGEKLQSEIIQQDLDAWGRKLD